MLRYTGSKPVSEITHGTGVFITDASSITSEAAKSDSRFTHFHSGMCGVIAEVNDGQHVYKQLEAAPGVHADFLAFDNYLVKDHSQMIATFAIDTPNDLAPLMALHTLKQRQTLTPATTITHQIIEPPAEKRSLPPPTVEGLLGLRNQGPVSRRIAESSPNLPKGDPLRLINAQLKAAAQELKNAFDTTGVQFVEVFPNNGRETIYFLTQNPTALIEAFADIAERQEALASDGLVTEGDDSPPRLPMALWGTTCITAGMSEEYLNDQNTAIANHDDLGVHFKVQPNISIGDLLLSRRPIVSGEVVFQLYDRADIAKLSMADGPAFNADADDYEQEAPEFI